MISTISILLMILSVVFYPVIKIKKVSFQTFWIAPLLGSILLVLMSYIDIGTIIESLTSFSSINPIQILILFISMVFVSIVLDEVGFFKYLATIAVKKSKNSQLILFLFLYITVSLLTIFTSNDIIIITFTPFIVFFCKNAKISPLPYLIGEFVGANTWSMLLIIGNPTNIYLATSFQIGFMEYIKYMTIPTILASLASLGIMLLIFRHDFKTQISIEIEDSKILSMPVFYVSLASLILCIILLSISSWIGLPMWIISLSFALFLFIFLLINSAINKSWMVFHNSIVRLPLNLIPLLISMFIIVLTLHKYEITKYMFDFLNHNELVFSYGFSSFLVANLVNNIPMSMLYVDILKYFEQLPNTPIFATIIGSNVSAFFTPIGALAGIMWMGILKRNNISFSFIKFSIYGIIISIPTLVFALAGLYIDLLIF